MTQFVPLFKNWTKIYVFHLLFNIQNVGLHKIVNIWVQKLRG